MKNHEVADLLTRMGTLLEIKEENIFKIKAYHKAADNILALAEDIENIKQENRLAEIPGVGKAIEEKIKEYLETGRIRAYEELTRDIPPTVLEMVTIPSVGPRKAKLFFAELNIKSIGELARAAKSGKLLKLAGIKQKTIENILRGIRLVEEGKARMNLGLATQIEEEFIAVLKSLPEVKAISSAGSLRRRCETIRDIDILINSAAPQKVMDVFVHLPQVQSINAHGETKSSVITKDGVQVDLRVIAPASFGAALLYFTGSKSFNVRVRQLAVKKKMKVNEYGVFSIKGGAEKLLASRTEEDCFRALGLPYIAPELREEIGEAELFGGGPLPKLIEEKDIKGELHSHSTWSDGRHTIAEMSQAARERGYEYIAITDHSARLKIAGGVSASDLKKKKKEIEDLNRTLKDFQILFGTEVEIDTEGNLDYNDAVLSEFDFVIASIHSGFEQSQSQLTRRLMKACQNKNVHAIGHPTGRHIGKRDSYAIDFKEVCRAAVDTNTVLEINSFPIRLDLDSANAYFARRQGVKFTVNTDAHNMAHLSYMKFGIGVARRGWLQPKDVVNTLSLGELLKTIKQKK